MSVRLESIHLKKHGPLDSLDQPLKQMNLFYGPNESGKTYLVEFILQALFRQMKGWGFRDSTSAGQIEVAGLAEKPLRFSPAGKRKLEDFWQESDSGLPLNMARLLVVKGGDLALTSGPPSGISRDVLRSALTNQALLAELWDGIQPTVRKASLENAQIQGSNMGKLKDLKLLQEDHAEVSNLLDDIDRSYSQGPARQVELALGKLQEDLSLQQAAKSHQAFQWSQALKELEKQRAALDSGGLNDLKNRVRDQKHLESDLASLRRKLTAIEEESRWYPWLESAAEIWEEKGLDGSKAPRILLGAAGLALLALGFMLLVLDDIVPGIWAPWAGRTSAVLGIILAVAYVLRVFRWVGQIGDSQERKRIQERYLERFGAVPESLADIKAQKLRLQESHIAAQTTRDLIKEKTSQLDQEKRLVQDAFQELTGTSSSRKEWDQAIAELDGQLEEILERISQLDRKLSRLDIDAENYREEPAAVEYDDTAVKALTAQITALESELDEQHKALDTLKVRACERTGDEIHAPWSEVYYHLKNKHANLIQNCRELTAEIAAEIGLSAVLGKLKEEEDQKIIQALNTEEVSHLLQKATGRYSRLELVGDQFYVSDDYSRFLLQDISTGAREQVLLALRLGIASRLCGGDPLFLILDDAFQHSDWQRREMLVESTIDLAKAGWQVLYLSMDDHIRDLYIKKAKPALKSQFQVVNFP